MNTKKEKLKNLKSSSLLNHPETTFTDGLPPNENMRVHFYAKFGRQPTTIPTAREACLPKRPGKKISSSTWDRRPANVKAGLTIGQGCRTKRRNSLQGKKGLNEQNC